MNGDVVPAGQPLSFNYGAYDQSALLFVALSVYDITNLASPALVGGAPIPATAVFGGSYYAQFTPAANKQYGTYMAVYTDGTYTVLDAERSPDTGSFSTVGAGSTTLTPADIAAIAAAVWDLARAGHSTAGTFGEANQGVVSTTRANNLDNLNAAITTLETEASAASRATAAHSDALSTQSDIAGVSSQVGAVQTTVDEISGDTDAIIALDTAIKAKTDDLNFDGSNRVLAHTSVNDDKTGYELDSTSRGLLVDEIWDEDVVTGHIIAGSAGGQLNDAASHTPITSIATAVWDALGSAHHLANTFGDYVQVILQFASQNNHEIVDGTHGLAALKGDIDNQTATVLTAINGTNSLVNAIPGDITAAQNSINANVTDNKTKIIALSSQMASNLASILSQFSTTQTMISTVDGHVLTLQNNTTARFVVPDRMVIPPVPNPPSNYTFELRLYDAEGNPIAPDSIPTITVIRLDTGNPVVSNAPMTQYGVNVGAYYYTFPVSSGFASYPALVEANVTQGGASRLIPAVSETSPFEGDLSQVINQLTQVQTTVDDIDTQVVDGVHGLAAIKAAEVATQGLVTAGSALTQQVKNKTDNLPSVPASQADTQAVTTQVLTRPTLVQIQGLLNTLQTALAGPDARNLTQVYDVFDLTPVAKTNDPRFNHLDANVSTRSTLTALDVWTYVNRTLTAFSLGAADVKAIWDYLATSAVPLSMGARINSYLNAPVSAAATLAQITSLLTGVAQETTVTGLTPVITNGNVATQNLINALSVLTTAIKSKTDHLPSDPASAGTVASGIAGVSTQVAGVASQVTAVQTKTNLIPPDPARQGAVLLIPTNPVRDDDARLGYLDIAVSSRPTLAQINGLLTGLATHSDVTTSEGNVISSVDSVAGMVAGIGSLVVGVKSKTDHLPSDPAAENEATSNTNDILAAIGAIVVPPGLSAADVWAYVTRTLTSPPVDISTLATHADVAAINQYENEMSTAFDAVGGNQEIIAWATKNGRAVSGTNCSVKICDASGGVAWQSGPVASPNADGVFKFTQPVALSPSVDYYVVISIVVDGVPRINQRPFMTVA